MPTRPDAAVEWDAGPVELSPEIELVDLPCIDGEFVVLTPALRHPRLEEPVAFVGGRAVAPLLGQVRPGMTLSELAEASAGQVPVRSRPGHRRVDAGSRAPRPAAPVTRDPLAAWLRSHGLEQYAQLFAEHDVDLGTLRILTDDDLTELGLPFGPRKRILKALVELEDADVTAAAAGSREERRQLTVLFCDMVGFTELAGRVDPEVLHVIYAATRAPAPRASPGTTVTSSSAWVTGSSRSSGLLAHEGEAERAIRAGLEILDRLSGLEVPVAGRLRVRIGIATEWWSSPPPSGGRWAKR